MDQWAHHPTFYPPPRPSSRAATFTDPLTVSRLLPFHLNGTTDVAAMLRNTRVENRRLESLLTGLGQPQLHQVCTLFSLAVASLGVRSDSTGRRVTH